MEEEYLLNKMIKGKTEKEREIELMQNIIETKEKVMGWGGKFKIKNKQISASPENQYLSLIISYDRQWDRFKKAVFLC